MDAVRPEYLEIAHPHSFSEWEYGVMSQFAGQPVDLTSLLRASIPFVITTRRKGEYNDFVVIDSLYEIKNAKSV